MDIPLIHIANLLILISFSVRDIFFLRLLSVLASAFFIAYFALQSPPLWEPVFWNVVFIGMNAYQLVRLFLERRPVHLGPEEARLYHLAFRSLRPRELLQLLRLSSWGQATPDEALCQAGVPCRRLLVLAEGRAQVLLEGEPLAELQPGQMVGELSYLTQETPKADVVALEPTRFLAWDGERLSAFLEQRPSLRAAFQRILARDVAGKLRGKA